MGQGGVEMLTFSEREAAEKELLWYTTTTDKYWQVFGDCLGPLRNNLNTGEPLVVVWRSLQLCNDQGDTVALIRLLRLVAMKQGISEIIDRLLRPLPQAPAPPDPFEQPLMVTRAPFLARLRTRAALKALLTQAPLQPFVVVNGLPKLGKTYTSQFVGHVLHGRNDALHCVVELEPNTGAAVGPLELTRELVASMGGRMDFDVPINTNREAWYKELINWIVSTGINSGQKWWLVLDGFNRQELRSDTQDLIVRFAKRITNGLPQQRFRLILLDFDHTLLPVPPGMIMVDKLAPIPKSAVSEFIDMVFGSSVAGLDLAGTIEHLTRDLGDEISDLPTLAARLAELIEVAETGA